MSNDNYILSKFNELINNLNETRGTNAKLELLSKAVELTPLIKRIWDPHTTTGVTKKGLEDYKKAGKVSNVKNTLSLYDLFDSLCERKLSGDNARDSIWAYISKHNEYEDLLLRIFEKKPRIRMAETLLNTAFPHMFNIFKVALAQEYTKEDFDKELAVHKKAFLSHKIDGVRLITFITSKGIKFYSRVGNEWTSLEVLRKDINDHIVPELTEKEIESGIVLDGELIALNADGTENFKETISQSRKKDIQMKNPRYKIFDLLTLDAFQGKETSPLLEDRLTTLNDVFLDAKPKHCELLTQTPYTKEAFEKLAAKASKEGWEGIMIRFNSVYEGKRSRKLLKYKFFATEEFKVTSVTIVDMPFPNAEGGEDIKKALKNVIIMYKDCPVSVGSGFSTAERLDFAKHQDKIVGKLISVEYQEPFYDKEKKIYSLRCPIFKALIGDKRDF